jgi:hypothetical protein
MRAMFELAQYRPQDILAEAARYRLASQAVPDESTAAIHREALSRMRRVAAACGRILAAGLTISTHRFKLRSKEQAQTALSAAH